MVLDKQQKRAAIVDMAVPADSNIRIKEHEEIDNYQDLKYQLKEMWKVKTVVIPVVIGALGAVTINQGQ